MAPRPTASARAARSTRDVILDAAEQRFAEHGFAGVSVREIAGDAGLKNQASLYHHFRNKRALYEAVLQRGIEPIIEILIERAAIADEATPGTRVGRFVAEVFADRVFDYLVEHPHLPRLIQRAGLDDARHLRQTIVRLLRPLWEQARIVLGDGAWAVDELPHLAAGLYLLMFGYFASSGLLEIMIPEGPLTPTALEHQRRFLRTAIGRLLADGGTMRTVVPTARAARRRRP